MQDLRQALAISAPSGQIAAGPRFGVTSGAMARPGASALVTPCCSFALLDDPTGHPLTFCSLGGGALLSSG